MMVQIPYYEQETNYTCGPACMRMVLASLGIKKSEKDIQQFLENLNYSKGQIAFVKKFYVK